MGFGTERYFFTFIDDHTHIIETYIGKRKSKWLKSLKAFYNLVRIYIGLEWLIERLQSDYNSELQSWKVDRWLTEKRITFKLFVPYSQEENSVLDQTKKTIIDMVRATILERRIDDTFWPEIVLAMTYVKNLCSTYALKDNSSLIEM